MRVLNFSKNCVWHISHSNENSARYNYMQFGVRVMLLLFLSDFKETFIFWTDFLNIYKYQISWKSFKLDSSCSTWMEGQIDIQKRKLMAAFRNLSKVFIFHQLHGGRTILHLSNLCFTENTIHLHYKHHPPNTPMRKMLFCFGSHTKFIIWGKCRILLMLYGANRHSNHFTGIYGHSLLQKWNICAF
jgi:hypothetical protein